MTHPNGTFILLADGKAVCYSSTFHIIVDRLQTMYPGNPGVEYVITQIVGTVDKPIKPAIRSIYNCKT